MKWLYYFVALILLLLIGGIASIPEKHHKETGIPDMELTGHYWINLGAFLQEQGTRVVHVNPHHVKKSKELDDNNSSRNIFYRARPCKGAKLAL